MHAQQQVELSGILTDSLGTEISHPALVMVVDKANLNKVTEGEFTTRFHIRYLADSGKGYLLYAFLPGYKDRYVEITGKHGDLGRIALSELSQKLKEVVVKADALQHEVVYGDDVYKISGSVLANEYSLYTMLSCIPGIFVDGKKVEIVGRGTPAFTINGQKPRPGELDMVTPDEIEKVIINRAPSVKYANSVKGIIDIRMKRKLRDYLSARVNDMFQLGSRYTQNESSLQVNHKDGRWTNYLSYKYNLGKNRCDLYNIQESTVDADKYTEISNEIEKHHEWGHNLIISPKYQLNERSFVDIQYNCGWRDRNSQYSTDGLYENLSGDFREKIDKRSSKDVKNPVHQVAARYSIEWKNGAAFVTNLSYANMKTESSQLIDEQINANCQMMRVASGARSRVYTADMDYLLPLASKIRLNVGWEYSLIQNKTHTFYEGGDMNDRSFFTDTKDHMASVYADLRYVKKNLMLSGGVRGEYNNRSDVYNEENNFHAWDFSPRLNVSYNFSPTTALRLDYSFMTSRPSMSQLNPNPIYINKYLYVAGNPNLKLAKYHEVGLGLRLPHNVGINMSYVYVKDNIFKAILSDESDSKVSVFTYSNLKKTQKLSLSFNYWGKWSWYTLILNGTCSKPFVKVPYLDGEMHYNRFSYRIGTQHIFQLYKGLAASVNFNYNSKSEHFPLVTNPSYRISSYINYYHKSWWFYLSYHFSKKVPTTQRYLNVYSRQEGDLHMTVVKLGIAYKFSQFKDLFKENRAGSESRQRAN